MLTRDVVVEQMADVAAQLGVTLPPLSDDLQLLDAGLDSLFFAILVSRLEDATGNDPFLTAKASDFPRTLGELIVFYEPIRA